MTPSIHDDLIDLMIEWNSNHQLIFVSSFQVNLDRLFHLITVIKISDMSDTTTLVSATLTIDIINH